MESAECCRRASFCRAVNLHPVAHVTPRPGLFHACLLIGGALLLGRQADAAEPPAAAQAPAQFQDALHLVDVRLEAQAVFDRVPALSAGVVVGDKLVWKNAYGAIDADRKIAARADTIYGICSISKLFTSVAVMQLWESGRVPLDEDIGKLLPSFDIQRSVPDSGPITIRSLLTHSSGLPQEPDISYWMGADFKFPSREELYKQLGAQHVFMRASDRWQYSNLGMAILGEMVGHVSGVSYSDYVRTHILEPLGLSDTRPRMPAELYGKRLAQGFGALRRDGTRDVLRLYDARGLTPAAGFSSTVEDLARFAAWQFRLRKVGGREVLQAATLRDMQRVQWIDADGKHKYGLGFEVGGRRRSGHDGRPWRVLAPVTRRGCACRSATR